MNRIFKKVFNRKLGEYVVASEAAKGNKKSTTGTATTIGFALIATLTAVNGNAATFGSYERISGLNGTEIGQGSFSNPNYDPYNENSGIRVGSNSTYYNSNVIGTNELNGKGDDQDSFMDAVITNYSQNIGQALAVNTKLTEYALASRTLFGTPFDDTYYHGETPWFFNNWEEVPDAYKEIYAHTGSAINDHLNQKVNFLEGYSDVGKALPQSTKAFGGNNNFNTAWNHYSYSEPTTNKNALAIGRDNSFNSDADDSRVIGSNNTLSASKVEIDLFGWDAEDNYNPLIFTSIDDGPFTATLTQINGFDLYVNPNASYTGTQSTIIGNNTVSDGVNNIVIGSTTASNVNNVLESREQFMNQYVDLAIRFNTFSQEGMEAYDRLMENDFESPEEFTQAFKDFYSTYLPTMNEYRTEYATLLAGYTESAIAGTAGVVGNDSIAIGVNAKSVNENAKWWNNLLAKTQELADKNLVEVTLDEDYNVIDFSIPGYEDYYNRELEEGGSEIGPDAIYQDRQSHNQVAIGYNASSNHTNSVAIGINASTTEDNSIDFGLNRVTNVAKAINGTDAVTVQNLKDLAVTPNYDATLYQPFLNKVAHKNQLDIDITARAKKYSDDKDIIMNAELTEYLTNKTNAFIVQTVDTNSKEIAKQVAEFTNTAITDGTKSIQDTIQDISAQYAATKTEILNANRDNLLNGSVDVANKALSQFNTFVNTAANKSLETATNTNAEINSLAVSANKDLNLKLDQLADSEDEATDKKILEGLIGKLSETNQGGSGAGNGDEQDNGLTVTYENTLNTIKEQDTELLNTLNNTYKGELSQKADEVVSSVTGDETFGSKLTANMDVVQAKAKEKGIQMLDEKDANMQNLVLNTVNQTVAKGNQAIINNAKTLDDAVYTQAVTQAKLKDLAIEETLLTTASKQDEKILADAINTANSQDAVVAKTALDIADKGDAQVLANVTEASEQLGKSTSESAKTYANEQDKLVYNRMLEVLATAPSSNISNIYTNINNGDVQIIADSVEYIAQKDAAVLENIKDYADNRSNALEKSFTDQSKRMEAGVASAVAASMLGQSTIPGAHTLGASVGIYGNEVGYAFGASTMTYDSKYVLKAGFTVNSKNKLGFMSGAGFYVE